LGKILPEPVKCGDFFSKPEGHRPLLPKAWVCVGRLIFAGFFIFLSVNIILKKSLLYLSFESFLEKENSPYKIKRIRFVGANTPQE